MGQLKRGELRLLDGGTFSFVANARQQSQLPVPSRFLKNLWLWLRETITISGVTVPGNVHQDAAAHHVRTVELLVDGFPLKFGSGPSFIRQRQMYGYRARNNGLTAPAAGVYNCEALIPLMFELPAAVSPTDALLDGRLVKNLVLNVTWGAAADVVPGSTSTVVITNSTLQVYIEDTDPFVREQPFARFKESEATFAGIVTNTGSRIGPLPFTRGSRIRSFLLRAIDGADLSDAVINSLNLRLNGNEETPLNTIEDDFLQSRVAAEFGADDLPDGYYAIELAERGLVDTTALGAGVPEGKDINAIDIIADTTVGAGATSVVVHTAEILPPGV